MYGWEEIVSTVERVYPVLPEKDKAGAAFLTPNYGTAGAIEHLGGGRGLPRNDERAQQLLALGTRGKVTRITTLYHDALQIIGIFVSWNSSGSF